MALSPSCLLSQGPRPSAREAGLHHGRQAVHKPPQAPVLTPTQPSPETLSPSVCLLAHGADSPLACLPALCSHPARIMCHAERGLGLAYLKSLVLLRERGMVPSVPLGGRAGGRGCGWRAPSEAAGEQAGVLGELSTESAASRRQVPGKLPRCGRNRAWEQLEQNP